MYFEGFCVGNWTALSNSCEIQLIRNVISVIIIITSQYIVSIQHARKISNSAFACFLTINSEILSIFKFNVWILHKRLDLTSTYSPAE